MSFDRYLPCPGGTGKKIKFCCEDMLGELESVQRMLEGEQRLACLEHVEKTLKNFPDRPCLLAIKAMLHAEMNQDEALDETLKVFETKHPGNPVALAERAVQLASSGKATEGVVALQTAIAAIDEQMPTRVYEAIGLLGRALLSEGNVLAAQAHLLLQAAIGGTEDPRAMSLLAPLMRSAEIPVILRDERQLAESPQHVPFEEPFQHACGLAARGAWQAAAEQFDRLAKQHPSSAEIHRNLAILRSWLGQTREAVAAWRCYSMLDTVPADDAIEAEAIAQLIDPDVEHASIALACVTFETLDSEALAAQFTANSRTQQTPVESAIPLEEEGQPPPQSVFILLDKEMPETGVGIQTDAIPNVLGQCYLYGRQTDRDARLEFVVYRDGNAEASIAALKQLTGDLVKQAGNERVLTEISASQHRLTWNWRLPADTPVAHREALVAQKRRDVLFETWTNLPNPALSGKTPREAAQDAALDTRLQATLLVLEMSSGPTQAAVDFDELRKGLGVPLRGAIDPAGLDLRKLPLVRMARVDVERLDDKQLMEAYRRSAMMLVGPAIRRLVPEVIGRKTLEDKIDKAEAYGILSSQVEDIDEALQLLEKVREASTASGQSPAPWLLAELEMRLTRGDAVDAERLLRELQSRHFGEPGIAQAVYEMLAQFGVIDPRALAGAGVGPSAPHPDAGAQAMHPIAADHAAASTADQIWTPDAASHGGQKKSTIWTPDD